MKRSIYFSPTQFMTLCAGIEEFQSVPLSATKAAHELWHQGNTINDEIQGENKLEERSRN